MSKWLSLILLLVFCFVLQAANGKSYKADKYAVDMYLLNDGSVRVVEEVVFQFTGGPFRFVTRDVPGAKVNGLVFQSAAMDSTDISETSVPNYFTLNKHNGLHLKWYYAPLKDETHSFSFQYIVNGMYSLKNGMARLQWKPLPSEYEYSIDKAVVKVHLPKEIPMSKVTFDSATSQQPTLLGDSLFVYEFTNLSPNTVERVDFTFPENLITIDKSKVHSRNSNSKMDDYIVAFILVSFFITFFWVFIAIRMSVNRTKYLGEEIICEDFPSSLEPALLGRIMNGTYSTASSVYATLVNLAQRGVVKMISLPKEKWYEANGSISFEYQEINVELTPTEQGVIEYVFGRPPRYGAVKLLELQKIITSNFKYLKVTFEDALIKNALLDPFQMDKRKKLLTFGLILNILAFVLFFGSLAYFKTIAISLILPLIGIFLVGNIVLMMGAMTRIFTDTGMMEVSSWSAYAKFLRRKMKEPLIQGTVEDFNRVFPFALVLNLGREWVTYFKKNGIDIGNVWLESDPTGTDSFAPYFLISSVSSPTSNGNNGATGYSGGGSCGGGGGGGGSSAG